MKKITKLLSVLLILSMLLCSFVACNGDEDGPEESSSSSSSSTSSSKQQEVAHNVTVKDGLTGIVLESVSVPDGRGASSFIGHYDDLHYGYELDKKKANEDYTKAITEDTVIVLSYNPLPIYTIHLQDMNGNLFDIYYQFKRALTPEEMGTAANPGLNSLDEPYVFGHNKNLLGVESDEGRNDYISVTLTDCIQVYKGYSISFDDIPAAPSVFNGDFLRWDIVEEYDADFTNGTVSATGYFNGAGVVGDIVVRAKYTESGTGAVANAALAELSATPETVFANLSIEKRGSEGQTDAYYDAEYKHGHEKIKYGEEKTYIGKGTDTTFKFATGLGTYMYAADRNMHSTDPIINKFNGTSANAKVHVDQNTYIAFDGRYMYALVVVRDDTATYISDSDAEIMKGKIENGESLASVFYRIGDCVEVRYSFNINNKYTDLPQSPTVSLRPKYDEATGLYSGGEFDHTSTAENAMRTMSIDRSGNVVQIGNDAHEIKQSDFVSIIDLAPSDDSRMTAKLSGVESNDNGYAIGLRFDVQGYINAVNADDNPDNNFDWDTSSGEGTNYFGIAFIVQVNDRQSALTRLEGTDNYQPTNWYTNEGKTVSNLQMNSNVVSAGVQRHLDEVEIFRLALKH